MKPSADGRSASLIILDLDSSMHALGHTSRLAGSTKKGLRRYRGLRWLLVGQFCEMRRARPANLRHAGLARSKQVWLVKAWVSSFAGLHSKYGTNKPGFLSRAHSLLPS